MTGACRELWLGTPNSGPICMTSKFEARTQVTLLNTLWNHELYRGMKHINMKILIKIIQNDRFEFMHAIRHSALARIWVQL